MSLFYCKPPLESLAPWLILQYLNIWCLTKLTPNLPLKVHAAIKPLFCLMVPSSSQNISPFAPFTPSSCVILIPHHLYHCNLHLRLPPSPPPQLLFYFQLFRFILLHLSDFPFSLLQGNTIESEHLSELTEEEYEAHIYQRQDLKGFMWLDAKYLNPFFTRRLTQEVRDKEGEILHSLSDTALHQLYIIIYKAYFIVSTPTSLIYSYSYVCFWQGCQDLQ